MISFTDKNMVHGNETKTDFHYNEIPPEESLCLDHTRIIIDLVFKNCKTVIFKHFRRVKVQVQRENYEKMKRFN